MKYTLQDLQEEKVYIEITCDEDFNKLLPYTNIVKCGTDIKNNYPYQITFCQEGVGWESNLRYLWNKGYQKIEINDLFFDLDDLKNREYYIELKNKEEIEEWKEIITEKIPDIIKDIIDEDKVFISFYDSSYTIDDESYIEDGYKKVYLEFINKTSKEKIKTKLLTFTIDGESTYNLEIKWEDWELLKQGNKLKLL